MIFLAIGVAFLIALLAGPGCATIDKNADPLVVRVEQTETMTLATVRTFLKLDNDNRAFFKTNAPALHAYAEFLRVKQPNGDRRYVAYLRSLNQVKLDYKAGRASSNDVVRVVGVVQSVLAQVNQYQLQGK